MHLFISITDLLNAWDAFFFRNQPTVTISIFSILTGMLMIIEACQWIFYYQKWVSTDGYFGYAVFKKNVQPIRFSLLGFLPQHKVWLLCILYLQLCSATCLMAGIYPNAAACICFITTVSIHNRNPFILDSGDVARRYFCLLLIFAPLSTQWAAQGWPWPLMLIRLFVANIYAKNVLFKLYGKSWRDGSATNFVFNTRLWNRFQLPPSLQKKWMYQLTTYGTLFIETSLFTLIWIDELRPYIIIAGIIFHLLIWLMLRIGLFQLTMIAALLAFVADEEYMRLLAMLLK